MKNKLSLPPDFLFFSPRDNNSIKFLQIFKLLKIFLTQIRSHCNTFLHLALPFNTMAYHITKDTEVPCHF